MSSSSVTSGGPQKHGRKTAVLCSTPLAGRIHPLSSTSVSAIETNTSSSPKVLRTKRSRPIAETRKRKRRKVGGRRAVQGKKGRSSDDDWETNYEEAIYGDASLTAGRAIVSSSESVGLFRDNSPERLRDHAAVLYEGRLDSPLFGRSRPVSIVRKESAEKRKEQLPLRSRVPLNLADLRAEESEEDLHISKENIIKTYRAPLKTQKPTVIGYKVPEIEALLKTRYPNATANLLWDDFVKKNYNNKSRYRARSTASIRTQSESLSPPVGIRNAYDNYARMNAAGDREGRKEKDTKPIEMKIARGRWRKLEKKLVFSTDKYDAPTDVDVEFETGGKDGGRMTLDEFRGKCRKEKVKLDETEKLKEAKCSNLSKNKLHTISEPRKRRNVENTPPHRKHAKKAEDTNDSSSPMFNLCTFAYQSSESSENDLRLVEESTSSSAVAENKSKKQELLSADIPLDELRRVSELRRFASQLNERTKAASFDEGSSRSCKKRKVDEEQPSTSKKPRVKSTQQLTTLRYQRDHQNWRLSRRGRK